MVPRCQNAYHHSALSPAISSKLLAAAASTPASAAAATSSFGSIVAALPIEDDDTPSFGGCDQPHFCFVGKARDGWPSEKRDGDRRFRIVLALLEFLRQQNAVIARGHLRSRRVLARSNRDDAVCDHFLHLAAEILRGRAQHPQVHLNRFRRAPVDRRSLWQSRRARARRGAAP